MLLIDSFNYRANTRPFYSAFRSRPRVSLGSGMQVGHSVTPPHDAGTADMMYAACRLARSTGLDVSVITRGDLTGLTAPTLAALEEAGIPSHRVEFAMTAAQLRNASLDTLLELSQLRDRGVGLALHDFGRGTLDLVRRLPLSAVILVPSVIDGLPGAPERQALLHALVGLAHGTGLTLIATGIETEAQRAVLSGLGCDIGEGDLFGPGTLHRAPHGRARQ